MLLATGTEDVPPPLDLLGRKQAAHGRLRYCPICDAYEVRIFKLALAGSGRCRIHEALLLRGYTADLTLITLVHPWELPDEERSTLAAAGIAILEPPASELVLEDDAIAVHTSDGSVHRFDSIYVALGLRARSALGGWVREQGMTPTGPSPWMSPRRTGWPLYRTAWRRASIPSVRRLRSLPT